MEKVLAQNKSGIQSNSYPLLKPKRVIAEVLENYKKYWFGNFVNFGNKIKANALTEGIE